MIELNTALEELSWIPRPRVTALRRLDLASVHDLLTHYPRRHEDRREFAHFPREEMETPICLCGEVVKTRLMRFGGRKIFEAVLEEDGAHALSPPLTCRWFNLHYVQKMIATGQRLVVFGKAKMRGSRLCIDHPEFEVIEDDEDISIHFRRITPVYPATEGVSQRVLRGMIFRLLGEVESASADVPMPEALLPKPPPDALRQIHFPESDEELVAVREHLVLGEFFRMQLQIAAQRTQNAARAGQRHRSKGKLLANFFAALPFFLTASQQKVLGEIRGDLESASPMNRLLQGDVGSGKTVVAAAAMLLTVESGARAALMAPTQILAEQHYEVLRRWFEPLGVRLSLRTSTRREESFLPLLEGDDAQIVIGTHALLYEGAVPDNIGLAVIDEQHKFGVSQRARLVSREPVPDVLVMTATPIPRTLTMTVYGDLDVSTIDEMPRGRGTMETRLLTSKKIDGAIAFVRSELEAGRQAYIIYPLIDESEKLEVKAATEEFEQWQERLRPFRCDLLHGRIVEKQPIMQRFRGGETQALISTTVIEVGVDVPNATVMLIENAERFGLSQLHQLRGRTGRGAHASYCLLVSSDKAALPKLEVMARTNNGFEIAEADWEMRGPGDLLGTAQSGLPEFKLGDLRRDAALMRKARAAARTLLEEDPLLARPENQRFRGLIVEKIGQGFSQVS
ncbi:MAG: ATP-dependent DNA helicase RecG [Verrucomicrobiota bacterium]|nr:ATP-dependent DNA helicase RecG [Verrucomicrobiota bacterium]